MYKYNDNYINNNEIKWLEIWLFKIKVKEWEIDRGKFCVSLNKIYDVFLSTCN